MEGKPDFAARTAIVVGDEGKAALAGAKVSVFGLGGVGAACAMDLVRSGVGKIRVVDFDRIDASNLNRLCIGFSSTLGEAKVLAFARLAAEVNPKVEIEKVEAFFSGEEAAAFVDPESGWHADCVDSLESKAMLIAALLGSGRSFISSMGTAGRLAPERLKLGLFWSSSGCPLAKNLRARLRQMGVGADFPVVWSDEAPVKPIQPEEGLLIPGRKTMVQGSSPFVPQVAGHIMASWIVRGILGIRVPATVVSAVSRTQPRDML